MKTCSASSRPIDQLLGRRPRGDRCHRRVYGRTCRRPYEVPELGRIRRIHRRDGSAAMGNPSYPIGERRPSALLRAALLRYCRLQPHGPVGRSFSGSPPGLMEAWTGHRCVGICSLHRTPARRDLLTGGGRVGQAVGRPADARASFQAPGAMFGTSRRTMPRARRVSTSASSFASLADRERRGRSAGPPRARSEPRSTSPRTTFSDSCTPPPFRGAPIVAAES
jgi:hypothetical protein